VANYKLIIPHVKKNEGGLADTLKDTNPAKNPSPIKNPKTGLFYHTNKGIIWGTWVAWSKKKGIAVDAQRWYKMSDADWESVMKTLYWDAVYGDKINSQAVAEILFEAVWGGSAKSLIVYLQTYLRNAGYNIAVDGAMGKETYTALNEFTKNDKKHAQLIKDLTAKRLATLKTLGSWSWAGKAWTRRLEEIQEAGLKYITENPVKTGGGIIGLLLLGVGAYYLSKGGLPKI
jgi:lysozyme family protein